MRFFVQQNYLTYKGVTQQGLIVVLQLATKKFSFLLVQAATFPFDFAQDKLMLNVTAAHPTKTICFSFPLVCLMLLRNCFTRLRVCLLALFVCRTPLHVLQKALRVMQGLLRVLQRLLRVMQRPLFV